MKRKNVSEFYYTPPRASSTHDRFVYDALVEISDLVDFQNPIFTGKHMRSRSVGSAQALLVEIALQNEDVINTLKKYMLREGKDWRPILHYKYKY
jgi:hypothetical protein